MTLHGNFRRNETEKHIARQSRVGVGVSLLRGSLFAVARNFLRRTEIRR